MENPSSPITTVDAENGQTVSVVGDTYRILITGAQTEKTYAAIDMLIPPQGGPGPHSHANIQESFFVIEGEIVVKTKSETYTARQGSFVNIPQGGVVHSFKNMSDTTAHLLCYVTPSGLEEFFLEIGQSVAPGTFLPPPVLSPEDLERLRGIAEKYGQKLYPPDYLDK